MGKRKERRLAALSNAGRRVKLDLFVEPSEDLGGSQDDRDSKHEPALPLPLPLPLPNSPSSSSSGQQPPNPLLLLGQYSDDDESDRRLEDGVVHNSLADHADQVEGPLNEVDAGEGQASQKANQQDQETDSLPLNGLKNLEGSDTRERDDHVPNDSHKEKDSSVCNSISGTSELQIIGDVGSGWRMVMHEESNQYYYWNTETGETSWEVPTVLAQTTQSTSDQKAPAIDHTKIAHEGPNDSKSNSGVQLDDTPAALTIDRSMAGNLIHESKVYDIGAQLDAEDVGYKTESCPDVNEIESQSNFNAVNSHIALANLPVSENCMHDVLAGEEHKMGIDISSNLVKQGERLLERMKSLKVSEDHLQGQSWMSNYILEVEIRLSDIKSLLLYGSSMLPFWVHSERQLNRLEDAINNKIYQFAKSVAMDEADETTISFAEKLKTHESLENESRADGNGNNTTSSTPDGSPVSADANALRAVKFDLNGQAQQNAPCVSSLGSPAEHLESGATVSPQLVGNAHSDDTNSNIGSYAGEDDDMDVDMEVEDAIPASTTMLRDVPTTRNTASLAQYPVAERSAVAPLPDEDWIPPPPPDNEQIPPPPPDDEQVPPPPPPDEPPESYPLPPSYMETGQPLSCTEQYNISYPDSTYQYYGHGVTEVSVSNLYGHVDASQVAVPQPSIYYQAVPNTATSLLVNPVDTKILYDLQGQQVPSLPVDSSAGSSHLNSESDPLTYSTLASNKSGSTGSVPIERSTVKNNVSVFTEKTEIASVGISSSSATIEAPATLSVKENVSAAAAAAAAAAAVAGSSTTSKLQSKALRGKKRTVAVASSLRSSKKVSSLVDKWKAAKEELNEVEEDEPANAYEILEKKRQREIEEWHAQQIASGEAKDNANFQPLHGDWREKVKRRRAEKAKESKGSEEISAEVLPEGNQEPDLTELSKNLPSGWQAYWDEASKQVYYGNINTSETTWSRPTK